MLGQAWYSQPMNTATRIHRVQLVDCGGHSVVLCTPVRRLVTRVRIASNSTQRFQFVQTYSTIWVLVPLWIAMLTTFCLGGTHAERSEGMRRELGCSFSSTFRVQETSWFALSTFPRTVEVYLGCIALLGLSYYWFG
jgi:hypothetical protein